MPAHDDVVRRSQRTDLALGRSHEANPERLSQIPDAREEARRVRRALKLQAGEVIVMDPFVEQRFQEDLWREHLLTNRGQVVDANRAALRRAFPGDPIVAIGFELELSAARAMPLWTIDNRELASRQPGSLIEDVQQPLTLSLPRGGGRLVENRERNRFSERKLAPADRVNALAAFVGGSGHSLSLWGACPSPASLSWATRSSAVLRSIRTPTGSRRGSSVVATRYASSRRSATSTRISSARFAITSQSRSYPGSLSAVAWDQPRTTGPMSRSPGHSSSRSFTGARSVPKCRT